MKRHIFFFKGIRFYNLKFEEALLRLSQGGYLVAPAASALVAIYKNRNYYNSLKFSKVCILDSGFFCLLLRFFKNYQIKKFSGYLFLKNILKIKFLKNKKIFLIDPDKKNQKLNIKLFRQFTTNINSYVAPNYKNNFNDVKLIRIVKKIAPDYIFVNIGGEKQEILANQLIIKIKKKTKIICTGGAIGFITGSQAPINLFFDKYYMGWLVRLLHDPSIYHKRVLKSLSLLKFFSK